MTTSSNPYRLARHVIPSSYRIFLTPDLESATFAGRVEIDVVVTQSTSQVTLHALDLVVGAATLSSQSVTYRSSEPTYNEQYNTATFAFDEEIPEGEATLEIAFTGVLNDLLVGFYRSTFIDAEGQNHVIATTQFEHSDARRAFPCWDEPSFKATWQINLTVPTHLAAYSNSPETSSTDLGNGWRTVTFSPTMIMSSYLVAFVVGPFEETAPVEVDGVAMRVIYPRGKGHLAAMAEEAGAFALHFFSEYFDIPYPGDKLDQVAIPDFSFGAMENLGLVTYRESALLIDPETSSLLERQRVAEVICHETAHMWFGDLVTMEWWEGIWLNEAFATFMATLCADSYKPEWKMWVDFGIDRDAALQIDGLHSTRPIEYEVISPDDTRGMFDILTYQKGGSVLRMLEQYLGETVFRDGIRRYLKKHAYGNTVTTDLWDSLEEASGQPVREMMNTWILQGGHPLVTLSEGHLTQQPFAYGEATSESAIGSQWLVPVLTRSLQGGSTERNLLGAQPIEITTASPVVVNAGGSGVYRTRYGHDELVSLSTHIEELEELERATLVADSWAGLLAGHITWEAFLTTARGLGQQNEPNPWGTVASAVALAHRALEGTQHDTLVAQVKELFAPQFTRLGWDAQPGEGELTPQLRANLISTLGVIANDEAIQAEAVRRFETNELDGDLARSILRVVAHQNRPGDYEIFLERYRSATTPQDELRYLYAISDFPDLKIARDIIKRCFEEFRVQDAPMILGLLTANSAVGTDVWRMLADRWDEALASFPPSLMVRLTVGIPTFIKDPTLADAVEVFHHTHTLGGDQRTVEQYLERMRVGLAFAAALREQF
ncbi:MAG: M1 family metallopeptidase [Acidimicrobiaceae bacterium]|nr:M1 family metallopeptidase [Acidimicrobiaceae bacterium]